MPPLRGRGTVWRAQPARRLLPQEQERGSTPSWLPRRKASVSDVVRPAEKLGFTAGARASPLAALHGRCLAGTRAARKSISGSVPRAGLMLRTRTGSSPVASRRLLSCVLPALSLTTASATDRLPASDRIAAGGRRNPLWWRDARCSSFAWHVAGSGGTRPAREPRFSLNRLLHMPCGIGLPASRARR